MTKKVGLVLISSSLILNGCSHHSPIQEPNPEQQVVNGGGGSSWWYFHHSGGYVGPGYSPGYVGGYSGFHPGTTTRISSSTTSVRSGGGFRASSSVSARGGFGASGHAFGGASS